MTREELNVLFTLKSEYRRVVEALERLRAKEGPGAARLDGMPKGGGGPGTPTENAVLAITALEEELARLEVEIEQTEAPIAEWIKTIRPVMAWMIFTFRYLSALPWAEVARIVHTSPEAAKQTAYRYLRDHPDDGQ